MESVNPVLCTRTPEVSLPDRVYPRGENGLSISHQMIQPLDCILKTVLVVVSFNRETAQERRGRGLDGLCPGDSYPAVLEHLAEDMELTRNGSIELELLVQHRLEAATANVDGDDTQAGQIRGVDNGGNLVAGESTVLMIHSPSVAERNSGPVLSKIHPNRTPGWLNTTHEFTLFNI